MKNLLSVLLVIGISSSVGAAIMLSGPTEVQEGTEFELVVSGIASDVGMIGIAGGVYADFIPPEILPISVRQVPDFGIIGPPNYEIIGNGWDFYLGGFDPGPGNIILDGDWFVATYIAGVAGTSETFGLYDYDVSFDSPVQALTVAFVPEPMSIALLGLGGVLIRRRSQR